MPIATNLSSAPTIGFRLTDHRAVLGLTALAVLLSVPPLILGFPTYTSASGHDIMAAVRWIDLFGRQFWEGDLYPRWLTGGSEGLGQPAFYFYAPLSYWLAALFRGPGAGWLWPDTALALTLMLGRMVMAIGCFRWLRRHASTGPAVLGSVFYLTCPYTLAIDVYVRSAFAETMALALLPWVFIGIDDTLAAVRGGCARLVAAVAALALTHLPLLLLTACMGAVYGIGQRWRQPGRLLLAATAGAAGIAVVGFYVVPAMQLQHLVMFERLFGCGFNCNAKAVQWFLDSVPFRHTRLHLLLYILWQIFLTVLAVLALRLGSTVPRGQGPWWPTLAALLVGLWLLTGLSGFVWANSQLLSHVQFPWRLMGVLSLLSSLLLAMAAASVRSVPRLGLVALIVLLGLGPTGWSLHDDRFLRGGARMQALSGWWSELEYVTTTWTGPPFDGSGKVALSAFVLRPPEAGIVHAAAWHAGAVTVQLHVTRPAFLVVPQQFFPAWTAHDQDGRTLPVGLASPAGLLQVDVTPQTREVRIARRMLPAEWWGVATSVIGLVIALLLSFLPLRGGKHMLFSPRNAKANPAPPWTSRKQVSSGATSGSTGTTAPNSPPYAD